MKHALIYREKLWWYIGDGMCAAGYDQAHAYEQWLRAKRLLRCGRIG